MQGIRSAQIPRSGSPPPCNLMRAGTAQRVGRADRGPPHGGETPPAPAGSDTPVNR